MSLQFTDEVNGQNVCNLPTSNSGECIEIALVAAAKSGDAAAFEELVCRHRRRLRRVGQYKVPFYGHFRILPAFVETLNSQLG
jgi:hypothetical protein